MYLYHGTTKEHADRILVEGFLPHTCFTPYLATALSYGGEYVFKLADTSITEKDLGTGKWEWHYDHAIPPDEIIALLHYCSVKMLHFNQERYIAKLMERKIRENGNVCVNCKGAGEMLAPFDGHEFLPRGGSFHTRNYECVVCEVCRGKGHLPGDRLDMSV